MIKLKDILYLIKEHCTIEDTETDDIMDWYGNPQTQQDFLTELGERKVIDIYYGLNNFYGVCIVI